MALNIIKYMGSTATQELINLIKADIARKQDILQFTEMPDYVQYVGRTVQYVGTTSLDYTHGHFYHSTGFTWEEVYKGLSGKTWTLVSALPSYTNADFDTIYLVHQDDGEDNTVDAYVKGNDNDFYQLGGGGSGWKIADTLPAWNVALDNVIYFIPDDNDLLKGYIKAVASGVFYQLGGGGSGNYNELEHAPTINGIRTQQDGSAEEPLDEAHDVILKATISKYAESTHWRRDAAYEEDQKFMITDMDLQAFKDEEILDLFDEVTA